MKCRTFAYSSEWLFVEGCEVIFKVCLDDIRPAPKGWRHVKWP